MASDKPTTVVMVMRPSLSAAWSFAALSEASSEGVSSAWPEAVPSVLLSCWLPDGFEEASPPPEPHAPVKNTAAQTKLFVHGHLDQVCLDQSQVLRNIDILVEGFGIIVEEIEVDAIVPAVLPGRYLQPVLQERGDDAQLVLPEFDILVFKGQCDGAAVHEEEEVVVQNAPGEIIVDVSFYILDISHIEVHFVEIDGVFHGGLLPPVCDTGFVIHNCIILFSAACTSGFCWAGKVGHWDWRWFKAWEEGI